MTDSTESQTDSSEKLSESGMMANDSTVLGRGSDVWFLMESQQENGYQEKAQQVQRQH